MENKRAFKGVWIPKEIWLNKDLGWSEKLVLVEIDSLDNEEGCYAGNQHFKEFFGLSTRRIIDIINSLVDKGYVSREFKYKSNSKMIEKRILKVVKRSSLPSEEKFTSSSEEKFTGGGEEKCTDNNTVINNTINNKYIYSGIIDYLNEKTKSKYKSTTKKTQGLILARMNEGFNEKDFIKVIDNKCNDWLGTDYEQYLRPETLFGTKFESYLNQKGKKGNKYGNGNANVRQDFNASENEYTGEVILPEKHYTDDEVSDI